VIYLDSSALVKLVVVEDEAQALSDYLDRDRSVPVVTSALTRVELARAARRTSQDYSAAVARVLSSVDQIPLSRTLLDEAGRLDPGVLRSLHAIHLASARRIATDLTAFVAYDTRLLEAAAQANLPTATPGWFPS
jgi:uncharacterized protein